MVENHAGHQTSQITICVHAPAICHSVAAFMSIYATERRQPKPIAYNITLGERRPSTKLLQIDLFKDLSRGRKKLNGMFASPTRKDREKLRVARADKNIPSSSREKHCINVKVRLSTSRVWDSQYAVAWDIKKLITVDVKNTVFSIYR